jgi:hypothetical protein
MLTPGTSGQFLASIPNGVVWRTIGLTDLPTGAPGQFLMTGPGGAEWNAFQLAAIPLGAVGDILTTTVGGVAWQPLVVPSAWDHVVRSLADLPAAVGGVIDLTSGSWAFAASVNVGTDAIRVPPGVTVLMKGMGGSKILSADGDNTLWIEGTVLIETLTITNPANSTIRLSNVAASCTLLDCTVQQDADGADCVLVDAGAALNITGGTLITTGTFGHGVQLGNDIADVKLIGLTGVGCHDFVLASSAIGACQIIGCRAESDCTRAVTWSTTMPTQGLTIQGCAWNMANPYVGFTHLTAGVNCKGNLNNAGPMSETPIVP